MNINGYFEYFSRKTKLFLITVALGLDLLIGTVGSLSGYRIHMDIFYLIPISFAVWFVGKRAGIAMSFVSIATRIMSRFVGGKIEHSYFIMSWNTAIHLAFFIVITLLLTRLKDYLQERTNLISELRTALNQVKELSGILPICASCKKIRNDKGYWQHVEEYLSKHTNAEFSHGLCQECSMKLYPQYYKGSKAEKDVQQNGTPPQTQELSESCGLRSE